METKGEKLTFNFWHISVAFLIGVLWVCLMTLPSIKYIKIERFKNGYKQGQIDALNGIQNYDRIIKKDTIYLKIR